MGDDDRVRSAAETGQTELAAVVEAGEDYDAEELADLTRRLPRELQDLDIDSVDP
jgi:hypothetical protein